MTDTVDVTALEHRDRALTAQAVRLSAVSGAAALAALVFPHARSLSAIAALCLFGLGLDFRASLSLRNCFVVYAAALFVLCGHLVFPDRRILTADLALFLAAFLAGYALAVLPRRLGPPAPAPDPPPPSAMSDADRAVRGQIERLLWLLAGLQAVRLALLMMSYGVRSFYGGQELGDRITAYGQGGATTQALINIVLTALVAATVAIYARHCLQTGVGPNYRLLFLVLLAGPAISFQRSMLVYHGMLFVATYLCLSPVTRSARRAADDGRPRARNYRTWLVLVVVLAGAAVAAIRIGDIRAKALQRQSIGSRARRAPSCRCFGAS